MGNSDDMDVVIEDENMDNESDEDIVFIGEKKADNLEVAVRKKNEGNELYKKKQYKEAIQLYSQAIDLCPQTASFYSNRSACHMMLSCYPKALADAHEAVRLDPSFVKGHVRIAKCNIALGDANAALSVLRRASEIEASSRVVKEEVENAKKLLKYAEQVAKAAERGEFREAVFHLERAFELAPGCRTLKTTKAEYLVFLKRYTEAQLLSNEILHADPCDVDALYVRGMCLYYQDKHDHAVTHFQHALRLTPDHKKAKDVYKKAKLLKTKKDAGNCAFTKGNYRQALELYTEALAIDTLNSTTNSKLFCNRATVKAKLNQLEDAVLDCTAALNLNESYVKALLRRAKCYQVLEKHDDAVRDYHRVVKIETTREHACLLEDAKEQQKRSKRKDYYKILGISKTAGEDEIKRSYKKMAMQHHPDRHANANDAEKREHEFKFKDIGEAYAILSDVKKRSMYDRGQDVDSSMCGGFNNDDDLLHMFRDYFPGGPSRQPGEFCQGGQQFQFDGNNGGDPSSRFFFQF